MASLSIDTSFPNDVLFLCPEHSLRDMEGRSDQVLTHESCLVVGSMLFSFFDYGLIRMDRITLPSLELSMD